MSQRANGDNDLPQPSTSPRPAPRASYIRLDELAGFLSSHAVEDPSNTVLGETRPSSHISGDKDPPALPIPPDASIVHPPNLSKVTPWSNRRQIAHRPTPQVTVTAKAGKGPHR
ncbi:hypothetical protein MVEN_00040300 [Mycena venus]|uniref:Uncharacterized protein n=1 Tax=Mycena venus TaxID=2733690 RepID=A0A8H6Z3B9_9AGAR|nr:hypothetical protein MVEN_00040300 [Mycena venus]